MITGIEIELIPCDDYDEHYCVEGWRNDMLGVNAVVDGKKVVMMAGYDDASGFWGHVHADGEEIPDEIDSIILNRIAEHGLMMAREIHPDIFEEE